MKRTFLHNLNSSFTLWFDHTLLNDGEAFRNYSGSLYEIKDDRFASFANYSSPFKQWVFDSSVSGAEIPSGVLLNGSFIEKGTQGLHIDYNNGRTLFESGNPSGQVSASYSVKEFNIYRTNKSDQELVLDTKFEFNPKFGQNLGGISPTSIVAPCVFIKLKFFENEPFEFAGMDQSVVHYRCIVIAQNEFQLDGLGNIFVDKKDKNFLVLDKTPLNEYGDTKQKTFNYKEEIQNNFEYNKLAYIDRVDITRMIEVDTRTLNPDMKVGFLDFEIKVARFT